MSQIKNVQEYKDKIQQLLDQGNHTHEIEYLIHQLKNDQALKPEQKAYLVTLLTNHRIT